MHIHEKYPTRTNKGKGMLEKTPDRNTRLSDMAGG
jgi:hypothetical protein